METNTQIKDKIHASTLSKREGVYTARYAFFYRHGRSEETCAQSILKAYPQARILDKGEHYAAFRGGASVANQSHWYVKFKTETIPTKTVEMEQEIEEHLGKVEQATDDEANKANSEVA